MTTFHLPVDEGLELRLLEMRHAEEIFALVDANREHLGPWLPWVESTRRVADVEAFLRGALEQLAAGNGFHAGLYEEGRLAGVVGHHEIQWTDRCGSLGYWLAESSTGRGLMTRAVGAVTRHAFDVLGLHRVEIRCAVDNAASRGIPERLGFEREGILREALHLGGRYRDAVLYAVLASDWP